jgi:uncharacterized protein
MSTTLATAALLMGLAGGPHCAAMCGAACAGVVRILPQGGIAARASSPASWLFHAGRLTGYSLAGAAAAQAVQSFAWLTSHAAALRPVWTMFHLVVLAWGLTLLVLARQPSWVSSAARLAWMRMRPVAGAPGGLFTVGALWAFMPCGLLYSALLVASLSGGPVNGAVSMALFATGSAVSIALAPALLERVRGAGNRLRKDWGTRASGLLLTLAAVWALWADAAHRIAIWCGLA